MRKLSSRKNNRHGRVNGSKLRATTETDIQRYIKEDGDDEFDLSDGQVIRGSPLVDVKSIRRKLRLSQAQFAGRYGLSRRTLQQWEQGRAVPDGPARALLEIISRYPEAARRAIAKNGASKIKS